MGPIRPICPIPLKHRLTNTIPGASMSLCRDTWKRWQNTVSDSLTARSCYVR